MNCQEFSKRVGEFVVGQKSQSAPYDALLEHAAICSRCGLRLENERALTAGLQILVTDELSIEAPSFLRNDLLAAFANRSDAVPAKIVFFPSRSNWARWALAAAAAIILGFTLFSTRWAPKPETNESARNVVPPVPAKSTEEQPISVPTGQPMNGNDAPVMAGPDKSIAPFPRPARTLRKISPSRTYDTSTQAASSELKSEFVPLTYLNDATAMDSGIVVRVEIAREQLATLGLPIDLERADEIIKADIVLGDDGVARAIRLVQ